MTPLNIRKDHGHLGIETAMHSLLDTFGAKINEKQTSLIFSGQSS